jgi:hypothetical protein
VGHVARVRAERVSYRDLVGRSEGRRTLLKDPGGDVSIILKWVFKK